ncbi:response regulator [Singulisphaera acidiphila]|uniref:Response regulator containing a CheY-like receiver domain and an HTH DNA-binding domain n=1 Tax=Singulisphaera acidiphila (strain ATCC BAA-1392 / DSM 18658 / VKM B-2454 / MOB10) TaxID=886293 RepID=L0DLT4_SINAD|nr:response regulator transcription factor [Singulisphaera acidiphila]AGA29780.1 response regulator containing a CheY-like receiver domain and an HTH DNA-binding domain [Singulisphaera acidiphila DSM 18658]
MSKIRVVLADDHNLLRAGIRALLEDLPGIEVVAEAADGREALSLVELHRPDIILMDIAMPGLSGLDVAARLQREQSTVKVIILTMHKDEAYVRRAILAGASGYLVKDSDTEELGLALRAVARGETYLSPAVSKHLVADYRRQAATETGLTGGLTQRQLEVLRQVAEGKTTKAIAQNLGLSIKTVESHRTLLMERLGIHDVAGLVRYAIRVGLITSDE